jgi:hypothetical protein
VVCVLALRVVSGTASGVGNNVRRDWVEEAWCASGCQEKRSVRKNPVKRV